MPTAPVLEGTQLLDSPDTLTSSTNSSQVFASGHLSAEAWIQAFKTKHGRPPRILHIGNIANNAYINAKLLNQLGADCDVICYDYYHIMGCPEWEDADFEGELDNPDCADWTQVNLKGYQRPRWFAQGTLQHCVEYLIARRRRRHLESLRLWNTLNKERKITCILRSAKSGRLPLRIKIVQAYHTFNHIYTTYVTRRYLMNRLRDLRQTGKVGNVLFYWGKFWLHLYQIWTGLAGCVKCLLMQAYALGACFVLLLQYPFAPEKTKKKLFSLNALQTIQPDLLSASGENTPKTAEEIEFEAFLKRAHELIQLFQHYFPQREDCLQIEEFDPYFEAYTLWKRLLPYYDVVQGYSTDGFFPLLVNHPAYVSYEHGTIRDIPFQTTTQGRLAALTYAHARSIIMTNADSIQQARRLQPDANRIVFGLHGFDERRLHEKVSRLKVRDLKAARFGFDQDTTVFLAPARHAWLIKGNDRVIHAVRLVANRLPTAQFKLVFAEWGEEIDQSKALIEELSIGHYFQWIQPIGKEELLTAYQAVNGVMDQFIIPCIGGVSVEVMGIGHAPLITALDDAVMAEFYGETPPLFNCHTPEEIASAMEIIITQPEQAKRVSQNCKQWIKEHHSHTEVLDTLAAAYQIAGVV